MALEQARAYLEIWGCAEQIIELEHSSATVVLAAEALGTEAARIAKTLAFWVEGKPVLIVTAGDQQCEIQGFLSCQGQDAGTSRSGCSDRSSRWRGVSVWDSARDSCISGCIAAAI